jgi:hypothetical protein
MTQATDTMKTVREAKAWECEDWPDWLHSVVEETNTVADEMDMSAEQAHAYAALAAIDAMSAGETVAWRWKYDDDGVWFVQDYEPKFSLSMRNITVEPLFAAPPADTTALGVEVERWHSAYSIAVDQAQENGARADAAEAALRVIAEGEVGIHGYRAFARATLARSTTR